MPLFPFLIRTKLNVVVVSCVLCLVFHFIPLWMTNTYEINSYPCLIFGADIS